MAPNNISSLIISSLFIKLLSTIFNIKNTGLKLKPEKIS